LGRIFHKRKVTRPAISIAGLLLKIKTQNKMSNEKQQEAKEHELTEEQIKQLTESQQIKQLTESYNRDSVLPPRSNTRKRTRGRLLQVIHLKNGTQKFIKHKKYAN
jgi:hypothetical protein